MLGRRRRIAPDRLEFERVWRDYLLLQMFDYLSLLCCLGLDSAGCGPVPAAAHGWGRLRVERLSPWAVALDPFPFPGDRLEVAVACRRLPDRRFADDADLRRALDDAQPYQQALVYARAGDAQIIGA